MNILKIKNYSNYLYIGGAILVSKLFLLIIPYATDEINYNNFNKFYYSAAIIILFGKLGFEFAINRIQINHKKIFFAVFINTTVILLFSIAFYKQEYSYLEYIAIFIYSFFSIIANIFLIKNLFEGSFKKYFYFKISFGIILIILLLLLLKLNIEIFWLFPSIGILWFFIIYSFNLQNNSGNGKFVDFYKLGIAGFVINGSLSIAFIADKYIVNHFFNLEIANAYTFAWALTAPMLYIGNMIEHSIFTISNNKKRKTIFTSTLLLIVLVLVYSISAYLIIILSPALIPNSINYNYLLKFFAAFLILYSLYTISHFPLNGILFKFINNQSQIMLAKIYPPIIFFFLFIIYYSFIITENKNYWSLIFLNIVYLFIIIGIKAVVVRKTLMNNYSNDNI